MHEDELIFIDLMIAVNYEDNFILLVDDASRQIYQISLNSNDVRAVPYTLRSKNWPLGIVLSQDDNFMYWTDGKIIQRQFLNGSGEENVFSPKISGNFTKIW